MKIIYVTARLPYGADEAFIIPEIRQLQESGHEVLIVPRSCGGPLVHGRELVKYASIETLASRRVCRTAAGVLLKARGRALAALWPLNASRSLSIALKNVAVIPKALWLADVAAVWKADHIHCHWAGTTATMAWLASTLSGIPWSFTAHRWDIVENNLLAQKARSATLARFISEDGLRMARAVGLGPEVHAAVVRMGVDLPEETAVPERTGAVVLCPARLTEVKGHRFLIEAWRILKDRGVAGELWLAGGGELRPRLASLIESLRLSNSVRFLGVVPHSELLNLYSAGAIDVVVLASVDLGGGNHEGVPVALVEAMGHGIPVVATASGGTQELVLPETGILVRPADPVALADGIERLLSDRVLRKRVGDAGRQRALDAHHVARVARELAKAFEAAQRRHAATGAEA
ncbi:MAG TPA: glycosyltransferase [Bryobacteraceae bacterium]|nr:glycosyltransferase [Bryobacteraceae bacterium]